MVEVDAFYLPDTRGVSYGIAHSKSSIGINALDPKKRRMEYFHNAGYFVLEGADYDALFPVQDAASGWPLFPYSEFMKFDRGAACPRSGTDRAMPAVASSGAAAKGEPDRALCGCLRRACGGAR